ncbi:MAG: hypothetical protein AAF270_00390 [Pseudomonadota bacterium]
MFWIDEIDSHLAARAEGKTLTHALMLAGRPGVGKRWLAARVARRFLGLDIEQAESGILDVADDLMQTPDFHRVSVVEGKQQISIEQVRELTSQFTLKSHAAAGKLALIEPADAMTTAAANSLLKTLEEPQSESLLILVVDDMAKIPATIASRTTIYRLLPPTTSESAGWLANQTDSTREDIALALLIANGAPLAARDLLTSDDIAVARQVNTDIVAIATGREGPMQVAGRWRKLSPRLVMNGLRAFVQQLIYARFAPELRSSSDFGDYVMDTRDAFCYLDQVNRLIARTPGSYNPELAMEAMLLPWAQGLRGYRKQQKRMG